MTEVNRAQQPISGIFQAILVTGLALSLPVVQWSIFGWFHVLLPLLSFYQLGKFGTYTGKKILFIAAGLSSLVFAYYQNLDLLVFSLAMLITGYVLHSSYTKGDSPAISGLKGFVSLAACWLGIFVFSSIGSDVNSYQQLINILDKGISEAVQYYRDSSEISAESLVILEGTLYQMQTLVPIIMPAILGSMMLFVIWLTMVIGSRLIRTLQRQNSWGSYRIWQLPEKLIWVVIFAGILALLPVPVFKGVGINSLIMLSVVYTFQGLAITVFFMHKWNVPILLRSFLYVMVVLQSFGTVVLLICGIADIWFDFRKMKKVASNAND